MKKTEEQQVNSAAIENPNLKVVDLETGIKRGDTVINTITISKPNVGALRDLSLQSVLQWDVNSMSKLLTRITNPPVTVQEINSMDVADYTSLNIAVTDFLLSAKQKSQTALTM